MTTEPKGPSELTAVGKVLVVLEGLVSESRLSDIAATTGLSNSTTHRILAELVRSGWAHHDLDDRRYFPGPRMYGLAGTLGDDGHIVGLATGALAGLRAELGFTVLLGLVKAEHIMVAARLDGTGRAQGRARVGDMVALDECAIGRAVLATRGEGPGAVRERGWALGEDSDDAGLRSLGAAVLGADGRAIGGVGVLASGPELSVTRLDAVADAVRATAHEISLSLAGPTSG